MIRAAILSLFPQGIRRELRTRRAIWRAERELHASRWAADSSRAHSLPGKLFISLTSYPPRFRTLHLTLESLLQQTTAADGILLWIAHSDVAALPNKVRSLQNRGVRIIPCEDIRSYKKLVPALEAYPDAFIATADDDLRYSPDWLEMLVDGYDPSNPCLVCHRAHRVRITSDGHIAPYLEWERDVQDARARMPSADLIGTTGAGVLFFPGCLPSKALDRRLFLELCPDADDLWFFWMARLGAVRHRKVGPKFRLATWPESQSIRLFNTNKMGGNDHQVAALRQAFGQPDLAA
ncbi:glycosyltransferase family A protein [Sphingosinicella sp. CPCC 101087]|uniref:glycosyltransferase family A protein n=1 Tax=Sphingosinicella sp. CPCC 101087 TaxID=2497754 RepID=UPI00101D9BC0|nr:glycosyltransferase family A protein [Sphingosinicella sp. CPCC 101087]